MTISSRTPEGLPGHCVLCNKDFQLEFSDPGNDATCPNCGHLIRRSAEVFDDLKAFLERRQGISRDEINSARGLRSVGIDSLEMVEFVMELEAEFGISIPENDTSTIQTVGDAIRYILDHRRRETGM